MKNKFKSIVMISVLAVAGIFGVSSALINKQVEETPVAEEAKAAVVAQQAMRIYINKNWGGTPLVGKSFGPGNQNTTSQSISANPSNYIPASGTSVVANHSDVMDLYLSSSGQNSVYFTFFESNVRWAPWRNKQTRQATGGFNNALGLNDDFNVNFNNGYIYYVTDISGSNPYPYNCWDGGKDSYDGAGTGRTVKWYTYTISTNGVFVHFDLDGGSFSDSHSVDEEAVLNADYTLPAAPTKSGYTFMGWEAGTNGILNRASTTFRLTQPMTFTAIWASNTIQVVGGTGTGDNSHVRLWVSYADNGSGVGSLMYNGYGCCCKVWVHQGNGSAGSYEQVIAPTGTIYNNAENATNDLPNCPRRFDYYDVPLKYFTNNCYLNIQRFEGSSCTHTSGQIQLSSSDSYAFKIIYAQATWSLAPVASDITSGKSSSLLAAYGLSGIKTCCSNKMNGYGGYSRWYSTFAQSNSSILSGLSSYTITDYTSKSDYSTDTRTKNVNANTKYLWVKYKATGGNEPVAALGNFSLFGQDGEDTLPIVIIIVSSSIALLSITALSILVIKKRKTKEQE